jgi:hypothetical protein
LPIGDELAVRAFALLGEVPLAAADLFERDGIPARGSSARSFLSVSDGLANA